MFNALLGMGLVNSSTELADDAVHVIKDANSATDPTMPKNKRKQARKDLIKNIFNIATPIAVGAGVGAASYGTAALPAAQMTQSLVKSSGIGNILGDLFHPLLAPLTSIMQFCKRKLKAYTGINLGKWISLGTSIAEPIIGVTKAVSGRPLSTISNPSLSNVENNPLGGLLSILSVFLSSCPSMGSLGLLSTLFESKGSSILTSNMQSRSTFGHKLQSESSSFLPSFQSNDRSKAKRGITFR